MVRSRVLWILWLIATGICYVAAENAAFLLLAGVSLALPLLAAVPARQAGKKLSAELSMEAFREKGGEAAGKIFIQNDGLYPADRLRCQVVCENLLTGERQTASFRMAAPARMRAEQDFRMGCRHCGRVRVSLRSVTLYDPFGLFRFRVAVKGQTSALTLFAPQTFSTEVQIAYGENANMDSDEYSMRKPGYDPSETFAIREYHPGDRIRQIHWKLTEKFDSLMVRDYGLPIQNTVLLLLETGTPGQEKPDADCLDALAEALLSVSQELVSQQIVHSIGWQNHEENIFTCMEVETDEDLNLVLPGLLGAAPGADAVSVAEHYMEGREQMEFAHVVLFTGQHRPSLSYLAGQCLFTEVICTPEGGGYVQEDGIAMVGASPEQMAETLIYLEI